MKWFYSGLSELTRPSCETDEHRRASKIHNSKSNEHFLDIDGLVQDCNISSSLAM